MQKLIYLPLLTDCFMGIVSPIVWTNLDLEFIFILLHLNKQTKVLSEENSVHYLQLMPIVFHHTGSLWYLRICRYDRDPTPDKQSTHLNNHDLLPTSKICSKLKLSALFKHGCSSLLYTCMYYYSEVWAEILMKQSCKWVEKNLRKNVSYKCALYYYKIQEYI